HSPSAPDGRRLRPAAEGRLWRARRAGGAASAPSGPGGLDPRRGHGARRLPARHADGAAGAAGRRRSAHRPPGAGDPPPRPARRPGRAPPPAARLGIPIGAWRAVAPGMALFAKESFIDECAHLARADPLAYRDAML